MLINGYFLALLLACALLLPSACRETKNLQIGSFLVASILILLVGLRADTTDYSNYFSHFESLSQAPNLSESFSRYRDGGHGIIIYLLSLLSSSPLIYFLFYATASIGIYFYVYSKTAAYALFPWLIFITNGNLHQNMAQMRQGLVTAFFLLGAYLLYRNRTVLWASLTTISTTIQASAIATFAALALKRINSGIILYTFLVIALLASLAGGAGEILLAPLIPYLDDLMGDIQRRYDGREEKTLTLHFVHVGFIISFLFVWFRHKIRAKNSFAYFLIPIHVFGSAVEVAFRDVGLIGGRVGDTFTYGAEPIIWAALIAAAPMLCRMPLVLLIGSWFIYKFVNTNLLGDPSTYTFFFISDYY